MSSQRRTKIAKNAKKNKPKRKVSVDIADEESSLATPKLPKLTNGSYVYDDEISSFVFMGLTGTSVLPIPPRLLEISMFAVKREDLLLMHGQEFPRVGNRLTLSFHPQRSIPIWTMQHTGMLNSTVKDECTFSENDFNIINGFLNRLPKPVCLISYQAELYDFFVLRRELRRIKRTFDQDLLCASLRKAVSTLCKSLTVFDLDHVHKVLCSDVSRDKEDTAENTVNMAMEVYSQMQGVVGWLDMNYSAFDENS